MGLLSHFNTEQKIAIGFLFYIYTVFIASFLLMPYIGIVTAGVLDVSSIPLMQITIFVYRLYMYKKSREEIEGTQYLMGWIIDRTGRWHSIDMGLEEKELIDITDQEMDKYEITGYHSGSSMAQLMRQMEYIAKNGYTKFAEEYIKS